MQLEDLVVAYYYRALQIALYVHTCKIGYCRKSWVDACKLFFPFLTVCLRMHQDDDIDRQVHVRRYPQDDRWVKAHILSLTVLTLCNIQTNAHHPEVGNRGLGYSFKHQTKPELRTILKLSLKHDDAATHCFKCQYVSLAAAAAFA